ncbi:MAG: cysteine--tRNA ligase [Armatimonadota bacterium]
MLKLYNTVSRTKETFDVPEGAPVKMYSCGPTVYDFAHIGNLRTFLFNDILCRYLRYKDYETHQVMNITDVDDKTIAGAKSEGISLEEYTRRYEEYFMADLETLRIEDAWKYPRATEHIEQMIELVRTLQEKGHAYERDGSVYFDISSWSRYGRLSGVDVGKSGEKFSRMDEDEYDRDEVHDFVLWKAAKEDEPSWDSPWGPGRPGWHIECSALGLEYLGPTLDIHTGAVDLIFPHHENEIAQAEAATGETFCRFWVHPAHLIVDGMKMSKSLGNFYTLRDLLEMDYEPMAIRHQLLTAHYRHQLDFTLDGLDESTKAVHRLWDFIDRLDDSPAAGDHNSDIENAVQKAYEDFEARMDDDLNVPGATGAVFTLMNEVNKHLVDGNLDAENVRQVKKFMDAADSVLGYIAHEREALDEDIEELIQEREEAREAGNYDRADEIRDELQDMGIVLEDTPEGTHWRRVE